MEKIAKHRTVRLKEKDINLFNFISKFGFATVEQINSHLGGSINSLKTRLSHLVNDGYLLNHRIFYGKPSVYTVTQKACSENLSVVKQISVGKYEHDLLVIDVFLKLQNLFVEYSTERMIRSERGVGIGKKGRIPDLKGTTHNNKSIAIEVDRTDKSLDRLRAIIASYALIGEIDEIWFICSSNLIFNNIEKVNCSDKVKIFHLKDVLSGKKLHYKSAKESKNNMPKELEKSYKEISEKENKEIKRKDNPKAHEKTKETRIINPYRFSTPDEVLKDFLSDPIIESKPEINNSIQEQVELSTQIEIPKEDKQEILPVAKEKNLRDHIEEESKKSRGLFNIFKQLKSK